MALTRKAPMARGGRLKVKGKRRFKASADPVYLDWVRSLPCLLAGVGCVDTVQPHHVRSRGAGGTDRETVPLCWLHHAEGHQVGWCTFERRYQVDLTMIAAQIAATYKGDG